LDAGFQLTYARQSNARGERFGYARHLLRFQPVRSSITLIDALPE
jgi:hypothetical protein